MNVTRRRIITVALMLSSLPVASGGKETLVAWEFWDASDATNSRQLTHDDWNRFLGTYVVDSADGINRVDYDAVTPASRQALKEYLDSLIVIDPRGLSRTEQLAYWMNLYNALTVEVVLQNAGVNSIRKMGNGLFRIGPWRDKLVEITGQALSLDDIEHRILRPIFRDHRIHYGVNCASISCPNLMPIAYNANNVDALLDKAEIDYVNHERAVSFDAEGRLTLSSIFDWYAGDFASDEGKLLAYLARHHQADGDRLLTYQELVRYEYNWSLNNVDVP